MSEAFREMVIIELGIIKSGVPIFSREFNNDYRIKVNSVLRGGFLSGINQFIIEAFSDEIESFAMSHFNIVLFNPKIDLNNGSKPIHDDIFAYCIGDRKLKVKSARKTMKKIMVEFLKRYDLENFAGDLSLFRDFDEELDKIMK